MSGFGGRQPRCVLARLLPLGLQRLGLGQISLSRGFVYAHVVFTCVV
jgi:hypothetical protein